MYRDPRHCIVTHSGARCPAVGHGDPHHHMGTLPSSWCPPVLQDPPPRSCLIPESCASHRCLLTHIFPGPPPHPCPYPTPCPPPQPAQGEAANVGLHMPSPAPGDRAGDSSPLRWRSGAGPPPPPRPSRDIASGHPENGLSFFWKPFPSPDTSPPPPQPSQKRPAAVGLTWRAGTVLG